MLEKLLKNAHVEYKVIDEDNGFKLIKVNSKLHILYLYRKGNQFLMERDLFEYLDGNSIPYSILCHDISKNAIYYLKLNKKVNWVKSCFATCDKDELFLGKNVLNARITQEQFVEEMKKIK